MTRSLGDLGMHPCVGRPRTARALLLLLPDSRESLRVSLSPSYPFRYISAKPEMRAKTLDARDRVLVLGSDGIFDFVGSQEAINIAARHQDPEAAAREITRTAHSRWLSNERMSDDCTAVVVRLDAGKRVQQAKRVAELVHSGSARARRRRLARQLYNRMIAPRFLACVHDDKARRNRRRPPEKTP